MKIKVLLLFLFLCSNISFGQTFPDTQNPNRIENQVIGNMQRKLNQEKRLIRIIKSDVELGELLLAREKEQKRRVESKIKALNSSLKELNNKISESKKESGSTEKKIRKLYRSVIKTTKKIAKEQKKYYALKDRIKLIEQSIEKAKK